MHIVKTSPYLVSKLGVSFGVHAVYKMRWFAAELPKHENNILLWGLLHDPSGQLRVGLAANPERYPNAIEDEIDGIPFDWVGKREDFNIVRDKYCVDYDRDKKLVKLTAKDRPAPASK